ncbi:hypothetical protein, partial [Klebsiella quasipneumoniae]|uniref:hypothetical protein n=1 Tax=Klebsiella quasipneumoniae TaxID=1463165 RepID=UPI002731892B
RLRRGGRATLRAARLFGHVCKGLWIVALRFPQLPEERQHAHVQAWALQLLAHAGVRLVIQGEPPSQGPMLMVSNHISW